MLDVFNEDKASIADTKSMRKIKIPGPTHLLDPMEDE